MYFEVYRERETQITYITTVHSLLKKNNSLFNVTLLMAGYYFEILHSYKS